MSASPRIFAAAHRGAGEIFAVDRRTWGHVCQLGINAAVAYLVLARGSARDNRKTRWSVRALETRGLLSRGRATEAIDLLKFRQVIDQTGQGGKATCYDLRPAVDIPALRLKNHKAAEVDPDLIWLPNSLVDGAGGEPVFPLGLVTRPQDPLLLRLLVDLYHSQDLAEHGGVHWDTICHKYDRRRVCQNGPVVIWEFSGGQNICWPHKEIFAPHFRGQKDTPEYEESSKQFWGRWEMLEHLGLIQMVPHLITADTAEASVIHPLAVSEGEAIEIELGRVAQEAALALLPSGQLSELPSGAEVVALVPVPFEYQKVELVGLYRLRYRARTARTEAWWARLQNDCPEQLAQYRKLISVANQAARRGAIPDIVNASIRRL
jgi:hypothetical protein